MTRVAERLRHRWTSPQRSSAELTIRTCIKCDLVCHSRHARPGSMMPRHWKEYYAIDAPDVQMTVMPECVRATAEA